MWRIHFLNSFLSESKIGYEQDTFDYIPEDILERREVAAVGPF